MRRHVEGHLPELGGYRGSKAMYGALVKFLASTSAIRPIIPSQVLPVLSCVAYALEYAECGIEHQPFERRILYALSTISNVAHKLPLVFLWKSALGDCHVLQGMVGIPKGSEINAKSSIDGLLKFLRRYFLGCKARHYGMKSNRKYLYPFGCPA